MKKFYMIWRDGNYPPTKKHESFQEAVLETDRLCRKHPEENFYVLESLIIYRGEVSVLKQPFISEDSQC